MHPKRITRRALGMGTAVALVASGVTLIAAAPASAALPTTVRAAAYLGADELAETSLPATLDDGSTSHGVAWAFDAASFAVPYETVQIRGTAAGQTVTASVEVLPPAENPLVYFVDAGHGGDSQTRWYSTIQTASGPYDAAATLAAETLRNAVPDQRYDAATTDWGWTSDPAATASAGNNHKISVAGGDPATGADLAALGKDELGVRTNGTKISHRLSLDAGTYTLSSGFWEFYAGSQARTRGIVPTIGYTLDGTAVSTPLETATLSTAAGAAPSRLVSTDAFTIPAGATDVTLDYVRSSGEAPVLSWFAVASGDAEAAIDDAIAAVPDYVDVTVDAADIAADNVNGLTFKGFGVLSANSTSAVLMDYKAQHPQSYAQLLDVLFGGEHPIMNHVKIEMGNDRNNSTGSDAATKRTADEPANVLRNPGFQLAADARKLNPDLAVSILRWNAPAWADTNDEIYGWYKETILAAYREYGYMIGYVNPGVNEHTADLAWTKDYANRVRTDAEGFASETERSLYNAIEIVISDEVGTGTFGDEMVADASLRDAVSVAGFHYNTDDDAAGSFKKLAQQYDVEVWNSEAQATFSNTSYRQNNTMTDPQTVGTGIGGTGGPLEMANTIVKGFVNSNRTHFIYQPAIGSFYEGGQYSFKELVSARDPWSGWMHFDGGLAVLQHFSSFAETGWESEQNDAGIWRAVPSASSAGATGTNPVNGRNGSANYMTLAAPDASAFSTVVVNDSEYAKTYRITPEGFDLSATDALSVWETRAAGDGEAFDANYKRHVGDVTAGAAGAYTVTVQPYSIVTVTSLDVTGDDGWTTPLPVEGERTVLDADPQAGVLWQDDFDYTDRTVPVVAEGGGYTGETEDFVASRGGETGAIPLYTWDRNGTFEAYRDGDEWVLRQQLDRAETGVGGAWNGGDPITAVGDRRWTNYRATVDVELGSTASDDYAAIGARSSGGGTSHNIGGTAYALRLAGTGTWTFLRMGATVASGTLAGFDAAVTHELSITAAGETISGSIDGTEVFSWTDPNAFLSGWVDLASGFHHTSFDDLVIERVDGYLPYYTEYLDGLEMHDLADPAVVKLAYDGAWSHVNGGGMFEYQRSSSRNTAAGAGVSYTFTGSGLDVIGQNDGSAVVDVYVDGVRIAANQKTQATGQFQKVFSLRGLEWGTHTVRLAVVAGTLNVDAVGVAETGATGVADAGEVADAAAAGAAIERSDAFTDETWAMLQAAVAAGARAAADPAAFRLDAEGARQLVARIDGASHPLASRIVSLAQPVLATFVGEAPALPETLAATLDDGSTVDVEIAWADATYDTAWKTVVVTGTHGSVTTSARVEVVPRGVIAFGDVNKTATSALGYDSPAYGAIRGLVGALQNDVPDQALTGDRTWGHFARNAAGASSVSYKGVVAGPFDKTTTTGLYTANQVGARVGYQFTLPAGRYTLTAGSRSWWPEYARTADVVITADGESRTVDTITLDAGTPGRVLSYDVELAAEGPVSIALVAKNAQSPMLSWAAVTAGAYRVGFDLAGGSGALPGTQAGLFWGDAVEVPTGEPTRVGYAFEGWNTAADGSGVDLEAGATVADLAKGDRSATAVTLHAQWRQVVPAWTLTAIYLSGQQVLHDGRLYTAQWWTQGQAPGASPYGPWAEVGVTVSCTEGDLPKWTASAIYTGGEKVVHEGRIYTAQWWTRNQIPTDQPWGPWALAGSCRS
ncbi:carbohydrate-binding protein [Microbacterium telephonicum]|uniref:Chitodextrinase n=1 Tax=Microbacterium telephonicum TaxID=1714841 RepID=A0A498CA15_9MICO|nr:carbohydrate-binding protein [Microbacterium telephonicum]RLK52764.1 chitodextrinase [Microbacterium telephonicum]